LRIGIDFASFRLTVTIYFSEIHTIGQELLSICHSTADDGSILRIPIGVKMNRRCWFFRMKTIRGAKTMAFDPKTGIIFSATVENVPPNATGPPNPKTVVYEPGPFVALVVEK
jgi:hypothetical protein